MVKNCDLGLENAALGLRPRAVFSRPRSQFSPYGPPSRQITYMYQGRQERAESNSIARERGHEPVFRSREYQWLCSGDG